MEKKRIVVGVTGATGSVYAQRFLQQLQLAEVVETHLVISASAALTISAELSGSTKDFERYADIVHSNKNIGASIASGSYKVDAMIVLPCSMKTLASIATGVSDNLISRTADVTLKERRRLILMTRETPLSLVHLRNMLTVTEAGGIIFPPVPAFYASLTSIEEMVDQTVARLLDLLGLEAPSIRRWQGIGCN
jgi:polyprenyl P-hydroxybenzoate/phenylacrylic acid decarboxylase-like protein